MGLGKDLKSALQKNAVPIVGGVFILGGVYFLRNRDDSPSFAVKDTNTASAGQSSVVASRAVPLLRQVMPTLRGVWARFLGAKVSSESSN